MRLSKLETLCAPDPVLFKYKKLGGGGGDGNDFGSGRRLQEIKSLYHTTDATVSEGHVCYVLSGGRKPLPTRLTKPCIPSLPTTEQSLQLFGGAVNGMRGLDQAVLLLISCPTGLTTTIKMLCFFARRSLRTIGNSPKNLMLHSWIWWTNETKIWK